MIKNYTIGGLASYILVTLPFWEWEGDTVAQIFLWAVTTACIAWLIRLHDIDRQKARRAERRRKTEHYYIIREVEK